MNTLNKLSKQEFINSQVNKKEYYEELYKFALKLCRGKDYNAKDLVQDVILIINEKQHLFKRGTASGFMGWSKTILRNEFINEYRRKKRVDSTTISYDSLIKREDSDNKNNSLLDKIKNNDLNPHELLEDSERLNCIMSINTMIKRSTHLNKLDKKAILLRMQGVSLLHIAEKMGISKSSASSHVYTKIKRSPEFDDIKELFYMHHNKTN